MNIHTEWKKWKNLGENRVFFTHFFYSQWKFTVTEKLTYIYIHWAVCPRLSINTFFQPGEAGSALMDTPDAVRISCAKEEVNATLANLYLLKHALEVKRSAIVSVILGFKPTQLRRGVQLIAYEKVVSSNVLVVELRANLVVLHGATSFSW